MNSVNTITIPETAEAIAQEWRTVGFKEEAPAHIGLSIVAGDVASYRRLKCAACGHGGHAVKPWHRGREYRLLATCRKCGRGEAC